MEVCGNLGMQARFPSNHISRNAVGGNIQMHVRLETDD